MQQKIWIYRNSTQDGDVFRPNNWAERVAGNAASYDDHGRLVPDPGVRHCAACPGYACLTLDQAVIESRPEVAEDIRAFMKINHIPEFGGCPKHGGDAAQIAA